MVEAALREACEDRLGAALIRPGDSVIIRNEVFLSVCDICRVMRAAGNAAFSRTVSRDPGSGRRTKPGGTAVILFIVPGTVREYHCAGDFLI